MSNPQQHIDQIREILAALVDAVKAAGPLGCPGGVLYAALMAYGCTLPNFEKIMAALVASKKLVKRGECYHVTNPKGVYL